ncbi:MAG: hypothetical protein ABMA26_16935 [Limisphaerales bacterium]
MSDPTDALKETENAFRSLMMQQEERFRKRVDECAGDLENAISQDTGECGAAFNEVLAGCHFNSPPILGTLRTSPGVAKEAAAVLCKVSFGKGLVKGQEGSGPQRLGWNNLNFDAKGWCKALLLAQAPSTVTPDELCDLLTAKLFASLLVNDRLPATPRAVAEVTKEGLLTDQGRPIDE